MDGVGEDGTLHVRVAAAPVDSAANESLCRLLARDRVATLGVHPRDDDARQHERPQDEHEELEEVGQEDTHVMESTRAW